MDSDTVGFTALINKVKKDRVLVANSSISSIISSGPSLDTELTSPALKIQSRMLSSKSLAAAVNSSIFSLRQLLESGLKEDERDSLGEAQSSNLKSVTIPEKKVQPIEPKDRVKRSMQEVVEAEWESGSVNDPLSSSDGECTGESKTSVEPRSLLPAENSRENEKGSAKLKSKPLKGKDSAAATQSTFLPSLSVGYIRGSSESDWSGGEDAEDLSGGVRKNRRGQRARRA